MAEEKVSELLRVTDDLVSYISRYGGACRDCADNSGICPMSGLPCADAGDAIRHVLSAINYGVAHGYLPDPRTPTPVTEDVGDWVMVPREPTPEMVEAHYAAHAQADTVFADAQAVYAAMLSASPSPPKADGPGEVSVKPLEWHGPDYEDEYWATSLGERYVIRPPTGNGRWLAVVGGYFQTVEDAKAAAEAHNDARIRSALVSTSIKREA